MSTLLKYLIQGCQVLLALFLGFLAVKLLIYHYFLASYPYPNTFREGAMMTSTTALVHGLNPYDMSLQPNYMNQYGIVYPLCVWPWAMIFGTTMIVHRFVTAFFILACAAITVVVLHRMKVPVLLNGWAVLMLYASLLYPATSTPAVDPAATGTFFMLLTVFIPWLCKYSYTSLALSVLFGILSFYSKPYTFLGVVVMSSYLFFFVSKKKGLFYGLLLLVLFSISVIIINQLLPAYFDNCFFTSLNMTANWLTMERLTMQVHLYSHIHQWTLILLGCYAVGYILKNAPLLKRIDPASLMNKFLSAWQFSFNEPLIKPDLPLVVYACLWSVFVLYISLGRHTGATLWYFFQLLSPYFLITAAWIFSQFAFWPICCAPFLILNLLAITADLNYKYFDKSSSDWADISLLINQHDHILNSCLLAPMLIEQNKEFYDDGQTEYFMSGAARQGLMKYLFQEDERVFYQGLVFFADIRKKVETKQFDLIMLQPKLLPGGVAEDIQKYYKFEGQIVVYTPQDRRPYAITVWRPL